MPPRKKTTKRSAKTEAPKKDISTKIWEGVKETGIGFTAFLKVILDFVVDVFKNALRYSVLIMAAAGLLLVCAAFAIYLLSAGLGLKENTEWHLYLDNKIQEFTLTTSDLTEVEVDVAEEL